MSTPAPVFRRVADRPTCPTCYGTGRTEHFDEDGQWLKPFFVACARCGGEGRLAAPVGAVPGAAF